MGKVGTELFNIFAIFNIVRYCHLLTSWISAMYPPGNSTIAPVRPLEEYG